MLLAAGLPVLAAAGSGNPFLSLLMLCTHTQRFYRFLQVFLLAAPVHIWLHLKQLIELVVSSEACCFFSRAGKAFVCSKFSLLLRLLTAVTMPLPTGLFLLVPGKRT